MGPRILIYLLRRDLRLHDNPVFHEISQAFSSKSDASFTHLLPLYIFNASQIETSGFHKNGEDADSKWPYPEARSRVGAFWRCGPLRAKFQGESVWDLKESLESSGSGLCIRAGHLSEVIRQALEHYKKAGEEEGKIIGVWMTGDETTEEKTDEAKTRKVVEEFGKEFRLFKDEKYFIDDDDVSFADISELPDVFTTYRKSLEPLREKPRNKLPRPSKLPPLPPSNLIPPPPKYILIPDTKSSFIDALLKPLPSSLELENVPSLPKGEDPQAKSAHPLSGGESAALQRLKHLLVSGAMSTYKETRNGLLGADFSTKLSAYLASGCITSRQIHFAMKVLEDGASTSEADEDKSLLEAMKDAKGFGAGENDGTAAVRFELLWRDYMRLCARKFGTKLFEIEGFRGKKDKQWQMVYSGTPSEAQEKLHRFLIGQTGIGLIDASQREIFLTGYTSNRARQNVANFLAKTLHMDWRLGAEWYECMLIDYDTASNWGNWQYVSGVGNDPRDGRIFNPIKQALDYDSKGKYLKTWIPELRDLDVGGKEEGSNGDPDQEKLMGLFQAWRIDEAEKARLGIQDVEWVRDPMIKIPFSVGRRPRPNNGRGRGPYRGRGGNGGNGTFRGQGGWVPRGRGRGSPVMYGGGYGYQPQQQYFG